MSPDGCIVNLGSGDTLVKVLELVLMDQQIFAMDRSIAMTAIESAARTAGDNATKQVVGELCESNASLSPRERQILISIAEGKSNKLIARQVSLTESTLTVHLNPGTAIVRQAASRAIAHGQGHGSIGTNGTEA